MREENRLRTIERDRWEILERVSWPAIFAGAVLAVVIYLMLSILGVSMSAAMINPMTEQNPLSGIGILSGIWLFIVTIVAMFVGGWTAGRLSGVFRSRTGMLHGAVVWGLATLVAIFFVTSAVGGLLSGTAGILRGAVSGGAQVAAQQPDLFDRIQQELERRGVDMESIESQARDPETQQQAEQQAREAGEAAASSVATASFFTFLLMAVGLAAALWGGSLGVPRESRIETTTTERAA